MNSGDSTIIDKDVELVQLIERVASSDADAFQRLYKKTSPSVYGVLLRMFKSAPAAEDALQETYLKVWSRANKYSQSQGRPLTWIVSVARYHALDVIRSQHSSGNRDREYSSQHLVTSDTLQGLDTDIANSQLISTCLQRLDPTYRECVIDAFCGGYSHQELSERTGTALGTVKSWIRRSLKVLKDCVDELS